MLRKLRSNQGFTLIELLIVVAIIGILAAIAIPQFAKYRVQGFNASANSDLKNVRTSEESLFSEWQHYGRTAYAALPGAGGYGAGALTPAVPPVAGSLSIITTFDNVGTARGLQIPVGSNITVMASTEAAAAGDGASFTAAAKHLQGDTVYAADSDSTANYKMAHTAALGLDAGEPLTAAYCIMPLTGAGDQYAGVAGWVAQ